MGWQFSARVLNPLLDQVILDTGPLPAGPRNFQVTYAATIAAPLELQWRNAANTANKGSQILACRAVDTKVQPPFLREIEMLDNERIRIIAVTAIAGSVSVSLDIPL